MGYNRIIVQYSDLTFGNIAPLTSYESCIIFIVSLSSRESTLLHTLKTNCNMKIISLPNLLVPFIV